MSSIFILDMCYMFAILIGQASSLVWSTSGPAIPLWEIALQQSGGNASRIHAIVATGGKYDATSMSKVHLARIVVWTVANAL